MWWGYGASRRNPMMIVFSIALLIGLFMMMRGGFIPFFVIFFIIGPRVLRACNTNSRWGCDVAPSKRKNDPFEKAKNEAQPAEPVGYLMTDDGEVMEIVDEPDRAARRDDGFI